VHRGWTLTLTLACTGTRSPNPKPGPNLNTLQPQASTLTQGTPVRRGVRLVAETIVGYERLVTAVTSAPFDVFDAGVGARVTCS